MVVGTDRRTLKFRSGDEYRGDLDASGCMNGTGVLQYASSGDVYEGAFRAGLRHGVGAYHYGHSGVVTVSQFARDKLVGVGLRWSADRRKAWALLEGKIDPQNFRVAEPDPAQEAYLGSWEELQFDKIEHGQVSLGYAWELAVAFGLDKLAVQVGAPRLTPGIDVETTQLPWWASKDVYLPEDGQPTPAMRQAAYMVNSLRPTVSEPVADAEAWPFVLGHVVAGASAPPTRHVVDRSIFTSIDSAAKTAAKAAASARLPSGRADVDALYQSIRADMRRHARSDEGAVGLVNGEWVTPGAGPMHPSPACA